MKNGELADGAAVLRAKIDMASPNINLRDPALYRIKRATHHNTGDTLVHLSDVHLRASDRGRARERHALDLHARVRGPAAVLRLAARHARDLGLLAQPRPHQYEFARLNVTYVDHQQAEAQAAGRRGHRRRLGRSAHADDRRAAPARLHAGVDPRACASAPAPARRAAGPTTRASRSRCATTSRRRRRGRWRCSIRSASCSPTGPRSSAATRIASRATRRRIRSGPSSACATFSLGPELWIERDDFAEVPAKGFFRLFPGNRVRLKYGYVVECTGCEKDANGVVTRVPGDASSPTRAAARRAPTRSRSRARSPGSPSTTPCRPRCASTTACSTSRIPTPAARTSRRACIPTARRSSPATSSASLATAQRGERFQFERHGYFVADLVDHDPARPVFNRTATLRDTWSR